MKSKFTENLLHAIMAEYERGYRATESFREHGNLLDHVLLIEERIPSFTQDGPRENALRPLRKPALINSSWDGPSKWGTLFGVNWLV